MIADGGEHEARERGLEVLAVQAGENGSGDRLRHRAFDRYFGTSGRRRGTCHRDRHITRNAASRAKTY